MSAAVLNYTIQQMLANGFADQPDPGASGVLSIENKGVTKFEIVTAGVETRALEAATRHPVGALCIVLFKTDGGDLTVTGAEANVVLTSAGDFAVFIVTNNNGTKVWKVATRSVGALDLSAAVTRATAAAAANLVPVSQGANRELKAATPAALGTVAITTGHSATNLALIALVNALAAFGLVTHTWTDGNP